jgi:hypothetical protein
MDRYAQTWDCMRSSYLSRMGGRLSTVNGPYVELEWVVITAVARGSWPWPWIKLREYTVRALDAPKALREAERLTREDGYNPITSRWVTCNIIENKNKEN